LVALVSFWDLLVCAKDLFVEATPCPLIQLIELNSISDMTTIISSHSSRATMISSIHSVEL
jgi:hypothetical protein